MSGRRVGYRLVAFDAGGEGLANRADNAGKLGTHRRTAALLRYLEAYGDRLG